MKSYKTNILSKITIIFSMILSERHGDLYGRAGDPRCHIWESWPVCVNDLIDRPGCFFNFGGS